MYNCTGPYRICPRSELQSCLRGETTQMLDAYHAALRQQELNAFSADDDSEIPAGPAAVSSPKAAWVPPLKMAAAPSSARMPTNHAPAAVSARMHGNAPAATSARMRANAPAAASTATPANAPAAATASDSKAGSAVAHHRRSGNWVGREMPIRRKTLASLLYQEKVTMASASEPSSTPVLPPHLARAAFGPDAKLQRAAALELAQARHYAGAQNYLLLSLKRNPLPKQAEDDIANAVNQARHLTSRRMPDETYTWSTFPDEWTDRLRLAHHVFIGSGTPSAYELKAWIRMLLVSPALFGGPISHLVYALAELVKAKLVNPKRFEPPAKVLTQDEKSGKWYPGQLLPPDDEIAKHAPSKNAQPEAGSQKKKRGPTDGAPAAAGKGGAQAAAAGGAGSGPTAPKPTGDGATLRVRLKATADMPPRTAMLKQNQVMLDVEAGTPRVYMPGLLLLEAAALGRDEIVMALLESGCVSLSEVDEEANSALMHAAFNCTSSAHRDVCRRLLEKKADPEMINVHGTSPVDVALMRRDPTLRRTFRPSDSDKDFTRAARTSFPIHIAIDTGDDDIALAELGSPGNLEKAKVHGVTPLLMAARKGSKRIVQALLDRGAAPDRRSEHGCTPMYVASEEGHLNVMGALIASGITIERLLAPDNLDTGPLMRASENGHAEAVRLLLKYTSKKQCNASNQKGWNALLLAAFNGFDEVVRLLLAHGANPELGKKVGLKVVHTPLCYACQTGRLDCVRVLLESKADLEAQRAPIAIKLAQDHEHERCAEVLRQAGVTAEGVDDGKGGEKAEGDAKNRKKHTSAADDAAASSSITDLKAQLESVKERESEMITKLRDIKGDIENTKAALRKAKATASSIGASTRDEKGTKKKEAEAKPPWAFSPSGRWLPGLWAVGLERGGEVSCEFGEPAQSVSFAVIEAGSPKDKELSA